MADNLQIPKYKEKVITWSTEAGTKVSFTVSRSYRGILRLSPNDNISLGDYSTTPMFNPEGGDTAYQDSLEPAITQGFIRISTSDGYFIGLRINQYEVESDNVYVIGKSHHDLLCLYSRADNSFKIRPTTSLPGRINADPAAALDSVNYINKDITDFNLHATDGSFISVSHNTEERIFEYEQTAQLMREMIRKAMRTLQAIPPGSIHFVPINIHEYEKMILKGVPNSYFCKDGVTPNDPIVRDFLVCDGSLYKNEDFPELAKVLEGERIDFWFYDKSKDRMVQRTHYNDYSEKKWFRVPDLRARFIKSVMCEYKYAEKEGNETGGYMNDSYPDSFMNEGESLSEDHHHFITTAFYQNEPELKNYATVATVENGEPTKLTKTPGVMFPHNLNQTMIDIRVRRWRCQKKS